MKRTYKLRFLLVLILIICIIGVIISKSLALAVNAGISSVTPTSTTNKPLIIHNQPLPTLLDIQGKVPTLTATSAFLYDANSGQTLVDINGEQERPMASTTKIMTAIVALRTGDPDQMITITQAAVDHVYKNNGSNAGLHAGDQFRLYDLLYALMLPSGDDAAYAISTTLAGSSDQFVARMNLLAARLHLYQTHYVNADGLTNPDGSDNITSAYDLVKLTRYAMSIPAFSQIVKTPIYDLPANADHQEYHWKNTNYLLSKYTGMLGVKTGTTDNAGACLVFYAKRNGLDLIGVVLHSVHNVDPTQDTRYADTRSLLDWGFHLPKLPKMPTQKAA